MLSETLSEGLEKYRIGQKLRALRLEKGLGLKQLGNHTGLSAGMLSKLENGQSFPTLPTLLRVALVFGVGLDHFFAPDSDEPVLALVRAGQRLSLPETPDADPAYFFESLDFPVPDRVLESYLATFPPSGPETAPHAHDGVELVLVLDGAIEIGIHRRRLRLETGDSLYFDAGHKHSYRCARPQQGPTSGARIMVVVAPVRD